MPLQPKSVVVNNHFAILDLSIRDWAVFILYIQYLTTIIFISESKSHHENVFYYIFILCLDGTVSALQMCIRSWYWTEWFK